MSNNKLSNDDWVAVGKIVGLHGLGGNLRVMSHSGLSSSYDSGRRLFVRVPQANNSDYYEIAWAKPHKKGILLKFKGVDLKKAESIVGGELLINKADLPELEEDTYFWFDLIGLEVFSVDGAFLGVVHSIIPTGSNDVYVVREKGNEILIPAIASVIKNIDLDKRLMNVDLPEGL